MIIFLYIIAFCIFHYAVAIFFRKKFGIKYDRKTLVATLLFLIVSISIFSFASIESNPWKVSLVEDKIYWLVLITFGSYALIQFMVWSFYSLLRHYELTRLPRFTFNIFGLILFILTVVLSAKYFFSLDLAAFLVTSTVISAIVGLSVQDTLSNLFAGVSLQSEAPFNIGEWVFLGGQEGKVVDQNWRSLTLLSRENHRITLPNKMVAQDMIINYSRPTPRQIHIFDVGLDYSHPPNEVKNILNKLLNDMSEVTIDEVAFPFVKEYADSGIIYSLKFWIEDYGQVPFVQDKVLSRLWYVLNRKNIKIPYTINELLVQMVDAEAKEKEHTYNKAKVIQELKDFEWLSNLNEKQLGLLSEKAWLESYAKGETLITQGNEGDSMGIIISGQVDILIKNPEEVDVKVADKTRGDFFGEMSLLTGNPRSATIKAAVDTTVVVMDKKAFTEILLKEPSLLDIFVNALESNQSALAKVIEDFSKQENVKEPGRIILMRRIRSYLKIPS
ncbi:MAG: mechanosensitive ion channel [Saprospiraceae bacterium]|nr:mechanosensitive ion channel [Saprospiraceae bacterium]